MSTFHPVPVRAGRDRRDDRFVAGQWTPYARPAAGWVKSVQDDTCTVVILDEVITGVIYLDDKPSPGSVVEIETRGDLAVILNWYDHPLPPPDPEPELPYPFTHGWDPGPPDEPAWDAATVPALKDDSDATFVHFVGQTGHDYIELVGDTEALPTDHVTGITITVRGRCFPQDGTFIGLVPQLRPTPTAHGYVEYLGPPPDFNDVGMALPKNTFGDLSVTLTEEHLPQAIADHYEGWSATNQNLNWTTFDELVDVMRAEVFFMYLLYTGSISGTWDIASLNLIFHTEGGP
jgi:hypothetical protein